MERREIKPSGRPMEAQPRGGYPWRTVEEGQTGCLSCLGSVRQRESLRSLQGLVPSTRGRGSVRDTKLFESEVER